MFDVCPSCGSDDYASNEWGCECFECGIEEGELFLGEEYDEEMGGDRTVDREIYRQKEIEKYEREMREIRGDSEKSWVEVVEEIAGNGRHEAFIIQHRDDDDQPDDIPF